MKLVNKKVFLEGRTCITKGWYYRSRDTQPPLTQANQFRIDQGIEIGNMARSLYPLGVLVNEGSNTKNHEKTKQLLSDSNISVIFEATFIHNSNIARADILVRITDEWHLIEVKSSSASEDIKDELIDDLTYTTLILNSCNIKIKKTSLQLVSKNYRLGMENKDFFAEVDCTEKVSNRLSDFKNSMETISQATGVADRPEPKLIYDCRKCDFYESECLGKNVKNPIFDLPRLNQKKFDALVEEKIFVIEQIPPDFELTPSQNTVLNAVENNEPFIDNDKLKKSLEKIIFPAFYLDFESVSTAIPIYKNIAPYQEIVTQYSIHKLAEVGDTGEHCEFLSNHRIDDRRQLAEKLIRDIGNNGSVIVYHAQAEKRFINSLSKDCPDLSNELNSIINRIVDLEVILRESYYHPNFKGSYSIKAVLPVMVPELSYKELAVSDGQSASVVFAQLALNKYSAHEAVEIRKNLYEYCKLDTLAMVKIHKKLAELSTRK
jgi:hypothetical protein